MVPFLDEWSSGVVPVFDEWSSGVVHCSLSPGTFSVSLPPNLCFQQGSLHRVRRDQKQFCCNVDEFCSSVAVQIEICNVLLNILCPFFHVLHMFFQTKNHL